MEITFWDRTDWGRNNPSMGELIRVYNEDHWRNKFSKVISKYPYWEETLQQTVRDLMHRTDYEFFLARSRFSREIVGWIAFSFVSEGNETRGRHKFEAKLEQTEMYSNILETWKVESSGGKSNVWEEIKRTSSSLQAKHIPPDHCIINALVYYKHEQFEDTDIAGALIETVIRYWRNEVNVGTEWAIWVQAPSSAHFTYKEHGFEEVGEYNIIDIGDYGWPPKRGRNASGKHGWKFMVRREPSGSPVDEPLANPHLDKGKGREQDLNHRKPDKESQPQDRKRPEYETPELPEYAWQSADRRLVNIRTGQGNPPLSGEVEFLKRVKRNAEASGYRPQSQSKGKQREEKEEIAGPARPLQGDATVTSQPKPQDNFIPSKSEEDLIEAMREGGVDKEEIELVKALTFSLSDEVEE
ncbi:hypothetical protein BDR22DRAFT_818348 [Usnea florida]